MSAILNTKRAVERLILTSFPGVKIAFEGSKFTAPDTELYLRTQLRIDKPDDPTIYDTYYRERISFQVFVVDVINIGTAGAFQVAENIKAIFHKGLTIKELSTNIYVLNTPQIAGAMPASGRLVVPVIINLIAEVLP